jgi:GNAT superfamily N-acetyltransferase
MTEGTTQLRRADAADAAALAEVYLRARRAAAGIPAMVHPDTEVRAWIAGTVIARCETWLAQAGERPVALMVLCGDELDQLYVDPGHQGQGHGTALLGLAQALRDELTLWTFVANTGARRFYERHGFGADGEPDSDNEEGEPALRYRWSRRPDSSAS